MATEKEIEYLKSNFEYMGLLSLGFYDSTVKPNDYDTQIKRICEWFSIPTIFQYDIVMIDKNKYIKSDLKTFSEN